VSKTVKIAAFAAGPAPACQLGAAENLRLKPGVYFSHSFEELIVYFAFCHHFLLLLIFSISSKL